MDPLSKRNEPMVLNITEYAQELLDGLETINFPENVAYSKIGLEGPKVLKSNLVSKVWMKQLECLQQDLIRFLSVTFLT